MLDQVVETFDTTKHRPPLIFSHFLPDSVPDREAADSEYSFGVPEQVKRVGSELFAYFDPSKIKNQFKEWVKSGNLSGKSAGFYPPEHADNPTPGKWSLREISALGTKAPVIGDLTPLQEEFNFADPIEFAIPADAGDFLQPDTPEAVPVLLPKPVHKPALKREVKMHLEFAKLAQAHMEATGKSIQELSEITGIAVAGLQSKLSGTVEFAEGEPASIAQALLHKPQPSARELELEKQVAEFARRNEELIDQGLAEFAQDLASKDKGILLPGEVAGQTAVLKALRSTTTTVEFAGEGKVSALEAHKRFLSGLKPRIDYGESPAGNDDEPVTSSVDFAVPKDCAVEPGRLALHQKTLAYQAQHPDVSYIQAYKAIGGK
ncbi:MAG: hypothetical protein ACRC62_34035 [Microcoleus sp.]